MKSFGRLHESLKIASQQHVFLLVLLLTAAQAQALDITTVSGRKFRNCSILEVQADRIRIMHATGITSVDFNDLPGDLRKRYSYDPAKAAEARRQRIEKERIAVETNAMPVQASKGAAAGQTAPIPSEPKKQVPSESPAPTVTEPEMSPAERKQTPQPEPQSKDRQIALAALWDTKMQGGSATLADLQRLFAPHASPSTELNASPDLMLTQNVPYLCPLNAAKTQLKVAGKISTKTMIACPGFPRDSISYHSFDGRFEDHYNRMYIVVDAADQVVSVALVDESTHAAGGELDLL